MRPSRLCVLFCTAVLWGVAATIAAPTETHTPASNAAVSGLTQIAVTFSEAVTGVGADDLLINSEAALAVSGSGAGPYTFTFTQPSPGTVGVQWDFDHGIAGLGSGPFVPTGPWSYFLSDQIPPQELSRTPASGSTVGALTQVEILFTETVTGVDAADLLINGVAATAVEGSGGRYVFTFTQPPTGLVTFEWAVGHGIQDTGTSPNVFGGGSWTVTRSSVGAGTLVINEFLAANGTGLVDENSDNEDWVEIYNPGPGAVNVVGWALTNNVDEPAKWVFPSRTVTAGGYLVVFCSGKDRKPASGNLHTNFKLNENGEYLALIGPGWPRVAVAHFSLEFPPQRLNYSYGNVAGGALRYFATPTPGTVNGSSTLTSVTPNPAVSVARGTFSEPFALTLSAPAGATIRYTTDGSEPTETPANGTVYTGPLTISMTTVLRVVAFTPNTIPSETITHSYLFLDQVLTQTMPPGYPATWGNSGTVFSPARTDTLVPADYDMDMDPLRVDPNNAASPVDSVKLQRLKDGLRALPIMSIVCKNTDMFAGNGIYVQPTTHSLEKPCSLEILPPNGSAGVSQKCGIQIQGNAGRDPANNPKHSFKLLFKGDYGESSLNYRLFADSPVEEFDDIVLRADYNTAWRHWDPTQRLRGTSIRDEWVKDVARAMGDLASHSNYVHLFINGLYWGLYDPTEQPTDNFAASYLGGSKSQFDVVNEGAVKSGDATVYNAMLAVTNLVQNSNYEAMKQVLEMPEFIDYMLLHFFVGHQDWGNIKNWYAVRKRVAGGKFRYLAWDGENVLFGDTDNRATNADVPSGLHTKLDDNAEYRLDFADRVHRHMVGPDGALQPLATIALWQARQVEIDKAVVAESARWGDYRRDVHVRGAAPLFTRETHWLAENSRITGTYLPGRTGTVLTQLRSAGLYPTLNAPEIRNNTSSALQPQGQVSAGVQLKLTLPTPPPTGTVSAGTIYFTTDGNDPRVTYSGTIAATAQTYTTPIAIGSTVTLKARVRNGTAWSALNEATFTVGVGTPSIRITEIMYNPATNAGGAAAEFIELQNTGPTAVNVGGWYFEGVDFIFPSGLSIGPGARVVIANNGGESGIFAEQYPGVVVSGWFAGSLNNGGERLALKDMRGRTVLSVNYLDTAPWAILPDGSGNSLEIIDPDGDPDSAANWRASNAVKGTPGQANSPALAATIIINEVLATNSGAVDVVGGPYDYIELKNVSPSPVDLQGWSVFGAGVSYTFTTSTVVPPAGFLTIPCAPNAPGTVRLPLGLSANGDLVRLLTPAANVADAMEFGHQVADRGVGRVGGSWVLTNPTVGAENTAALLAPSTGNLLINEWVSNAVPGNNDWIELYNKHATLPVALQGIYFQTSSELYRFPVLAFLGAGDFLQLFAHGNSGVDQLDFKLSAEGTALAILDASGGTIDALTSAQFGAAPQGFSRGRSPDGSATIVTFNTTSSPAGANYLNTYTGSALNEVLARNVTGAAAPWGTKADWVELRNPNGTVGDLSGMRLGTTKDFATAWTVPPGTSVPASGYRTIWCDPAQAISTASGADLNAGLNLGDASGALYLFDSSAHLVGQVEWGFQVRDVSIGVSGNSWVALAAPTRSADNALPAPLGSVTGLRINEWLAMSDSGGDWLEFYNTSPMLVDLGGLYVTDDPSEVNRTKVQIAPLSFIGPFEWVKWEASGAPSLGRNHLSFALDAEAEYLRISNNDAARTPIDSVSFGLQAINVSEGRILDGAANIVALPGSPTPGARNVLLPSPMFTNHPVSQTVAQGASVTLTAAATGSAPLSFQWLKDGTPITGATSLSLVLNGVSPTQDGTYTVVASNSAGSVASNPAFLAVPQSYSEWAAAKGVGAATEDLDKDGLSNVTEFFHNLSPNVSADASSRTALPKVGLETGAQTYLTLTFRRSARAASASVQYQLSANLAPNSWGNVTPAVTENLGLDPGTGDPIVRVKFLVSAGEPRRFARLVITP